MESSKFRNIIKEELIKILKEDGWIYNPKQWGSNRLLAFNFKCPNCKYMNDFGIYFVSDNAEPLENLENFRESCEIGSCKHCGFSLDKRDEFLSADPEQIKKMEEKANEVITEYFYGNFNKGSNSLSRENIEKLNKLIREELYKEYRQSKLFRSS